MITIEILSAEYRPDPIDAGCWTCWLEVANDAAPPGEDVWHLPATAPSGLAGNELQAHFEERAAQLWVLADTKRYAPDVEERIPERRLLKALVTVIVEEFNRNRDWHERPQITREDVVSALRDAIRIEIT